MLKLLVAFEAVADYLMEDLAQVVGYQRLFVVVLEFQAVILLPSSLLLVLLILQLPQASWKGQAIAVDSFRRQRSSRG
jgi:hypothetical protein